MASHAMKTDPAPKTGGIVVHRGRPYGKVPPPASFAPPPTQCCEVIYDGPMQFAFAGPLHLPTLKWPSHCYSADLKPTWASHLAAGHVSDTLVKRGSGEDGAVPDSNTISFVSYLLLCK